METYEYKYCYKLPGSGYLVDDEWDGKSYCKVPVFTPGFFYDSKELLKKHIAHFDNHKIVKIKCTTITHETHVASKQTITPKNKFIIRCTRCSISNKPRSLYKTALDEYRELVTNNCCVTYTYTEEEE